MKRITKAALALAFGLGLVQVSQAAVSDQLTITITPNAYYAVSIDTANVVLDLGTVALGLSTQTVSPSTVTVESTFATTDLTLQGAIASAGTAWSFDANTASQELDALAAWATFTTIAHTTAPAQASGYFSGTQPGVNDSDVISTAPRYAGTESGVTGHFEAAAADHGFKDMDGLVPAPNPLAEALLWLRFRLPLTTTSSTAQNIMILLTAVAPN